MQAAARCSLGRHEGPPFLMQGGQGVKPADNFKKMIVSTRFPINLAGFESQRIYLAFHLDAVSLLSFDPVQVRTPPIRVGKSPRGLDIPPEALENLPGMTYRLYIVARRSLTYSGFATYTNVEKLAERLMDHANLGEISTF